jgi:hypothetical protein
MLIIAQIALGVITGGLILALPVASFIMWVQSQKDRPGNKHRAQFAVGLLPE